MIKLIIYLLLFAAMMFVISKPTLITKPFSLKFDAPYLAIGFTLIIIGVAFIQYGSKKEGYNECHKFYLECLDEMKEELKQEKK